MALKRLKTCEFGRNPDHLPENRKNQRKWNEFLLVCVRQASKWHEIQMLNFTMRTCVHYYANRFFVCKITSFMK